MYILKDGFILLSYYITVKYCQLEDPELPWKQMFDIITDNNTISGIDCNLTHNLVTFVDIGGGPLLKSTYQ